MKNIVLPILLSSFAYGMQFDFIEAPPLPQGLFFDTHIILQETIYCALWYLQNKQLDLETKQALIDTLDTNLPQKILPTQYALCAKLIQYIKEAIQSSDKEALEQLLTITLQTKSVKENYADRRFFSKKPKYAIIHTLVFEQNKGHFHTARCYYHEGLKSDMIGCSLEDPESYFGGGGLQERAAVIMAMYLRLRRDEQYMRVDDISE